MQYNKVEVVESWVFVSSHHNSLVTRPYSLNSVFENRFRKHD